MSDDIIKRALGMDEDSSMPATNSQDVIVYDEDVDSASFGALEDDFDYVVDNLKELISQGKEAIEHLMQVAKQSQHPRAYEVIATLLKATADMNNDIMAAHKRKHDIKPIQASHSKGVAGNVTNNLFVGSTAELQNFLEQQSNKKYE